MIHRSVKPQVAGRYPASERNTEGLDSAIQVLIVESVFVMPNPDGRVRHLVGDERAAIGARDRLDHVDGRSSPDIDGRGHAHREANGRKGERPRGAADVEPTVGCIVVHVALARVGLAPGVLVRSNVLRFRVVGRAQIQCRVQVGDFHENPVGRAIMSVARMVPGRICRVRSTPRKYAGKRIHKGAGTQSTLAIVQTRGVRIGATPAEMRARSATAGIATKATGVVL
jgi:hypothetical protein